MTPPPMPKSPFPTPVLRRAVGGNEDAEKNGTAGNKLGLAFFVVALLAGFPRQRCHTDGEA